MNIMYIDFITAIHWNMVYINLYMYTIILQNAKRNKIIVVFEKLYIYIKLNAVYKIPKHSEIQKYKFHIL